MCIFVRAITPFHFGNYIEPYAEVRIPSGVAPASCARSAGSPRPRATHAYTHGPAAAPETHSQHFDGLS
eukprot:6214200-Pleurochrysis_carterae.AAC.4